MAPAVEIVTFVATEAYKKDRSVTNPAAELLQSVPGFIRVWHGLQTQDQATGYYVIYWETVEHHLRYMADEVEFGKLNKALLPVCVSRTLVHTLHQDITAALEAPSTELITWTLHEGADRAVVRAKLQNLLDTARSELVGEFIAGGVGDVVEDERKFSVVIGWHSLERFTKASSGNAKIVALTEDLLKLTDKDLKFVDLIEYKKN